jgi:hypothetical protein
MAKMPEATCGLPSPSFAVCLSYVACSAVQTISMVSKTYNTDEKFYSVNLLTKVTRTAPVEVKKRVRRPNLLTMRAKKQLVTSPQI